MPYTWKRAKVRSRGPEFQVMGLLNSPRLRAPATIRCLC